MTKKNNVSKAKFLFTVVHILLFLGVMVYADVFGTSNSQNINVNQSFVSMEDNTIEINPDKISISENNGNAPIIHYVVQAGDSLERISKEFGIPVSQLKKLNKIKGPIRPGQSLTVSDNEEGILYVVQKRRTLKLFSEFYRLNIEDLMTLNYISDETEILHPGQELFINVTENRAYDIGLLERPQPILPKDEVKKKKVAKKSTTPKASTNWREQKDQTRAQKIVQTPKKGKTIKQRYYNPKINNGFAVGYCTWYAAIKSPAIFKYINENKQERPFGGNAKDRYANAAKAGIKTGKTPRAGAIIVYQQLRSPAGHVGIVNAYYPESWEMIIEDMNYVAKYIVTQRRDNTSNSKIIGYIYP